MINYKLTTTLLLLGLLALLYAFKPNVAINSITAYKDVYIADDLNNKDLFSFYVISDNHGASPYDNIQMARTAK